MEEKYIIGRQTLLDIASAIRAKKGTSELILTENFATEIKNLDTETTIAKALIDGSYSGHFIVPSGITKIKTYAFYNLTSLTGITIPEGVTEIGSAAIGSCSKLMDISLPDSLKKIDTYCFSYSAAFKKLSFGSQLTTIGNNAFASCRECLEYDFSACENIPTLDTNVFSGINANAKIIVPEGLYDTWVKATNWVNWQHYITSKVKFTVDETTGETMIYPANFLTGYSDRFTASPPLKAYYKFKGGEKTEITESNPAFGVLSFYSQPDEAGGAYFGFSSVGAGDTYFSPSECEFWVEDAKGNKVYSKILEVTE